MRKIKSLKDLILLDGDEKVELERRFNTFCNENSLEPRVYYFLCLLKDYFGPVKVPSIHKRAVRLFNVMARGTK